MHIQTSELCLPTWLENDGNSAAIGESLMGVGRRYNNFVYMYFATGFGGGVISSYFNGLALVRLWLE